MAGASPVAPRTRGGETDEGSEERRRPAGNPRSRSTATAPGSSTAACRSTTHSSVSPKTVTAAQSALPSHSHLKPQRPFEPRAFITCASAGNGQASRIFRALLDRRGEIVVSTGTARLTASRKTPLEYKRPAKNPSVKHRIIAIVELVASTHRQRFVANFVNSKYLLLQYTKEILSRRLCRATVVYPSTSRLARNQPHDCLCTRWSGNHSP